MSSTKGVTNIIDAFKLQGFEFVGKTYDGWFRLQGLLTPPEEKMAI